MQTERPGQRLRDPEARETESGPESVTETTIATTPRQKEVPSLDNFLVILPETLERREGGKEGRREGRR